MMLPRRQISKVLGGKQGRSVGKLNDTLEHWLLLSVDKQEKTRHIFFRTVAGLAAMANRLPSALSAASRNVCSFV